MGKVFLSAGVFPSELDYSEYLRTLSTSNVGMVAITDRGLEGALGANTPIKSWDEFQILIGSFRTDSYGAYAAKMFFENGGGRLFVSRVLKRGEDGGYATAKRAKIAVPEDKASTPPELFSIEATSFGKWGDKLKVAIEPDARVYKDGFHVNVLIQDTGATAYRLVEAFTHVTLDKTSTDYAVGKIASKYVRVVPKSGVAAGLIPKKGEYTLTGGDDGLGTVAAGPTTIADSDYVAALKSFADAPISTVFLPGITSSFVIRETIAFCAKRADIFPIFETPDNATVEGSVLFRNSDANPFNSSYGALYHPWLTIKDPLNGTKKTVPPTGALAGIYQRGNIWDAPAGVELGIIQGVEGVATILDQDDRDKLYSNGINPIASFLDVGAVVWGQKTLQIKPTALDRINVRRMLNFTESTVNALAKTMVFKPNTKQTWTSFGRKVIPFLQKLKDQGAIYDFEFICDESLNTPEMIDKNEMLARIFIKPMKVAEYLGVEYVITPTGATFSEIELAA